MSNVKYQKDVLSSNLYYVAGTDMFSDISKKAVYTAAWTVGAQIAVGNENSLKFSIPVAIVSSVTSLLLGKQVNRNKDEYNNALNRLKNVSEELMLLGYDIERDAIEKCTIYTDGLIIFSDKEENEYKLYEKNDKDGVEYYLLYKDDIDYSISDIKFHENITYQIKRGLTK
jgi:hypothetical protein